MHEGETRVLRFNGVEPLGPLSIKMPGESSWRDPEHVAFGTVTVPADAQVALVVRPIDMRHSTVRHFDSIGTLAPDDLTALTLD